MTSSHISAVFLAFLLILRIAPIEAQERTGMIQSVSDSDSSAGRPSHAAAIVESFAPPLSQTAITLDERSLTKMDYEEFSDWLAVMPGFYPLDRAALGAPAYGQVLGLSSAYLRLSFRGRTYYDHLSGAPELNWISPEALSNMIYEPFSLSAQGASVEAMLRTMKAVPPTSRIATRDGYYGLGTVDFDFGQKITPTIVLNGGGRVATYGGRFSNSEGYGLNFRSELTFKVSESLAGWGGVMQNKANAEVPFTALSYNRDRYDGDIAVNWKTHYINVYGVQQRAGYGGGDRDGWDEIGTIYRKKMKWSDFEVALEFNAAVARWRLKGMQWKSTTLSNAAVGIHWQRSDLLAVDNHIGLGLSDDFAPERHLGLRLHRMLFKPVELTVGITQHQRMPSRFETSADFAPSEHFLSYDPAFLQYPAANIQGNKNLRNETCTTIFVGPALNTVAATVTLSGFWYRWEDPVQWRLENGMLRSWNAATQETRGLLGWISIRPQGWLETGVSGSFAQDPESKKHLFPEWIGHAWLELNQPAFQNELILRLRIWSDYWGRRYFPDAEDWREVGDHITLNARISADLLGVHLYWGVNNILREQYELFPGYPMMHKEEVWGVSWNFQN